MTRDPQGAKPGPRGKCEPLRGRKWSRAGGKSQFLDSSTERDSLEAIPWVQTPDSPPLVQEARGGGRPGPTSLCSPCFGPRALSYLPGARGPVFLARVLSPPCPLLTSRPLLQGPRPCSLLATPKGFASFSDNGDR